MREKGHIIVAVLVALFLVFPKSVVFAAEKQMTVAELALYKGADRQKILEEGARKEGKLTFYTTGILKQAVRPVVDSFNKKYPYIKVEIWRAGTGKLVPRVLEEYKSRKHDVDVIELTRAGSIIMIEKNIIQPFYSPNQSSIEEYAIKKAPGGGVFTAGHYQSGAGVGYNTKLITKEELPKSYHDLLDPKWKSKMAIPGSSTGINWMGCILVHFGESFLNQLVKQDITVHMVSGRAILDMVINGEYMFSPTTFDSHVNKSKKEGAPIDWIPLEPVSCNLGQVMLAKNSPHPHASLLFIDFDLTKESGEIYKAVGYNSPHKDVHSPRTYKKFFGSESTEQFVEWKKLFSKILVKSK